MPFSRACAEVAEWQADPQWARKSPVRKDPLQPPVRWLVLPPPVQHRLRKGHLPVKVSHSDEITYLSSSVGRCCSFVLLSLISNL